MISMTWRAERIRTALRYAGAFCLMLSMLSGAAGALEVTPKSHGAKTGAGSAIRAATKTESSLTMVTFKTPEGQIRVALPADMRPGDAIVVSVTLEPRGSQEGDRQGNLGALGNYSLSLAGQTRPVHEPTAKWDLPADAKTGSLVLVLTDASMQEAARVELPVQETAAAPAKADAQASERIAMPTRGQPGRPIVFNQASIGGKEDVHVYVGDKEARLLAASPRALIVESPRDVLGKTKMQVKRGTEVVAEGRFRNDRVSSGNPWPFVIALVVIGGIVVAIKAAELQHDFGHFGPVVGF